MPTRSLDFLNQKKTIFKLLHQCGLVDVRVKQFVSEGKKVNGPLGTIGPKELPCWAIPVGQFFADSEPPPGHVITRVQHTHTYTHILVYMFLFFFENKTTIIKSIINEY